MFPGIGIKRRLVVRRAAAPGKDRETNEQQETESSQRHYL
jgi:hypothetical protein